MDNCNDKLFFQIWNNCYLNKHIFDKVKEGIPESYRGKIGTRYYKYNELNNVYEMINGGLRELLRYKIIRNEVLNFTYYSKVEDKSSYLPLNEIYEIESTLSLPTQLKTIMKLLFNTFKNEEQDKELFKSLFKHYKQYFISKPIINYIIECDGLVGLKALLEQEDIEGVFTSKLFINAIEEGSINVANYLYNNLKNIQVDEIAGLLNRLLSATDMQIVNKLNALYFITSNLIDIEISGLGLNITKKLIEYSVKSVNIEFILRTCYCISFLQSVLEKEKEQVLLSRLELDEIKLKLSDQELKLNILDLDHSSTAIDACNSIKLLVSMSIAYSGFYKTDNLIIFNSIFKNQFLHWRNKALISYQCSFAIGNYSEISKNINKVIEINLSESQIDEFIFRSCKGKKEIIKNFIKDSVASIKRIGREDEGDPELQFHNIDITENLIRLIVCYNDSNFLKYTFDLLKSKNVNQFGNFGKRFYSVVKSTQVFDILYENDTRMEFKVNKFLYSYKNEILHHFKNRYRDNYYEQIRNVFHLPSDIKKFENILLSDFFFNNLKDFQNVLNQIWFYMDKNCSIGKLKPIKLSNFIKLVNATPLNQTYSYLSSYELFIWVIENRVEDIENKRCQTSNCIYLENFTKFYNYFSNFKVGNNGDNELIELFKTGIQKLPGNNSNGLFNVNKQDSKVEFERTCFLLYRRLLSNVVISKLIKYSDLGYLTIILKTIELSNDSNHQIIIDRINIIKMDILSNIAIHNRLDVFELILNKYPQFLQSPNLLDQALLISTELNNYEISYAISNFKSTK